MCKKCGSKKTPELFTTPGAGTMLDNEDSSREFSDITMWAHACPDCYHVVDMGFDA